MRFPWQRRQRPVPLPEPWPDVAYDGFAKGIDIVRLAKFVRARVEDHTDVVDRYLRSRGRKPLPQTIVNVLTNHEREVGKPLDADGRARVLMDYVQDRRDWIDAIEDRMRNERRVDDDDVASMIVYAGHFNEHIEFSRAWYVTNFMRTDD
jgi:hypothetical protein